MAAISAAWRERWAGSAHERLKNSFSWLLRIDLFTPRCGYILRSTAAAALALWLAYVLQIQDLPFSAASTVLLVINPVQGAVIGKGIWRIIGTLVGMLAAFVLMAAFAQAPLLFILGFGAWLGLGVAGMTVLRHYRGSGAVVAGYTVGLATYGAMQHPELIFEHAVDRSATVVIGVVCVAAISALFSERTVGGKIENQLSKLVGRVGQWIADHHNRPVTTLAPASTRTALVTEIYGVDDMLALGKAESAEVAQQAGAVREGMAALLSALVGGALPLPPRSASAQALDNLKSSLVRAWTEASKVLSEQASGVGEAQHILSAARERLVSGLAQLSLADAEQSLALIAGDRLLEQLDDYRTALRVVADLGQGRIRTRQAPVRFHRDLDNAVRNGLRAMLAIVLAGMIWIFTGWDQGSMMLLVLAPYCTLLATAPDPAAGAVQFVKGTLFAVPAAFVCAFGILPHINGFPLLAIVMAMFWLPGIYATSVPRHALAGLAYLVAVNTLTGPTNPMEFDAARFLNWSVAWVLATLITVLVFRLILPRNLSRDIARLRRIMRDEALRLFGGRPPKREHWCQCQQHRLVQLCGLLKNQPERMAEAVTEGLAALHLGRELLRIRRYLTRGDTPESLRALVRTGLRRVQQHVADPVTAAEYARRAGYALAHVPDDTDAGGHGASRHLMSAAFTDIADLLEVHASFFAPRAERRNPC